MYTDYAWTMDYALNTLTKHVINLQYGIQFK